MDNYSQNLNQYSAAQNRALCDGLITEEEWFENLKKATTIAYLSRNTPWGQCGHSGTKETWMESRIMPLLETLYKSGTFIDIGCSIGYILECLHEWTQDSPIQVEYFGVDICDDLIHIARKRMPEFKNNLFVGNVDTWIPPRKFDYVRTHEITYVPEYKQRDFLYNLYNNYLKPGGRLIIGSYSESAIENILEDSIRSLGFTPTGYAKRSYRDTERKVVWFDK